MTSIRAALILSLCFGGGTPALAQNVQPYSTSMVECGVILQNLADLGRRGNKDPDLIAQMDATAANFLVAAPKQARKEGVSEPGAHVTALRKEMTGKWDGRFSSIRHFQENIDWIDYCNAFAKAQGVSATN